MPLLHTWSLAVEAQFYLIYPALLVLLLRRCGALRAIWAALALSFALHLLAAHYSPRWGFYLTPMRFWQLMAGAVLALGAFKDPATRAGREVLSLMGVAAILWSIHNAGVPGVSTALPTLGAALLIYANCSGDTVAGRCLSWRPLVFIGLISYSLYLWHWPIFVFARYALLRPPTPMETAGLFALSFLVASCPGDLSNNRFAALAPASRGDVCCNMPAAPGHCCWRSDGRSAAEGWPQRLDARERELASYLGDGGRRLARDHMQYGTCYLNAEWPAQDFWNRCGAKPGRINLLLWGDSHAAHYYPGLRRITEGTRYHFAQANRSGCPPALHDPDGACAAFVEFVRKNLADFDAVILSGRWRFDRHRLPALEALVADLVRRGIPVIVLGHSVEYHADVPRIVLRAGAF